VKAALDQLAEVEFGGAKPVGQIIGVIASIAADDRIRRRSVLVDFLKP